MNNFRTPISIIANATLSTLKRVYDFLRASFSNNINMDFRLLHEEINKIYKKWLGYLRKHPLNREKIRNPVINNFIDSWNASIENDYHKSFLFINQFFVALPYIMLSYTDSPTTTKSIKWFIGRKTFGVFKQWDQLEGFCKQNLQHKMLSSEQSFIKDDNKASILDELQKVYNQYWLVHLKHNERKIELRGYFFTHHWWVFIVGLIILGLIVFIIVIAATHKS
ncbi:hypothetical protein OF376_03110 [Ureaplasma miroungigenitalium]|uniref:Uncharacterized protein n=1 Tax=Ureaplasma miroungigenitalium TaxID=1042321 RepID=A0ABT3BNL6_9BACT|nr:hypothetical protein [Ureaplasma miroungigenitalium]MCV3728752.1 hypothetical protein [Ureaplasma miroungigenitalium]MCV3734522.1 hypothetical protein [Ureaplasma miroungigenitalium]